MYYLIINLAILLGEFIIFAQYFTFIRGYVYVKIYYIDLKNFNKIHIKYTECVIGFDKMFIHKYILQGGGGYLYNNIFIYQ